MTQRSKYRLLTGVIAGVWLINGLFCKVLNLVPRHQEIVEAITGLENARMLTLLIGLAEIGMAGWIISGAWSRYSAIIQILAVASMNVLETVFVPHLLLWGRINAFFAFLLIGLIYYNEFHLNPKPALQT